MADFHTKSAGRSNCLLHLANRLFRSSRPGRDAAGAGNHGRTAQRVAARCANRCRGGIPGARIRGMVRYFCSGADSQRDHRDAEQRLTHGTANQGSPGRAGQSIGRCWRPHAGRLCSSDQSRHRPLGADCEGIRIHALGLSRTRRLYIASEHRHGRRGDRMKRREFITLLGGAAAAWPLTGWAQPSSRMRQIGILMYLASDDADAQSRNAAFLQGLQELSWTVGQNVRVEYRWGASNFDPERMRKGAVELVALAPDVILATTVPIVLALQQVSRTVPIVFAGAIDPVGAGLVASLARPGGNATGFTMFEYGISAKWLELLKEISPGVKRVAVLREPTVAGIGQLAAMQTAAPSFGVELQPIDARDVGKFERALADFARAPNGGLIVPLSTSSETHRTRIVALADRHRLPAVYPSRLDAAIGGLISYGPDMVDQYRRAAGYVDRILKGEKPADLPVQHPTKYELVINLKTAKTLGLTVPPSLLARADEVIE